MVKGQGVSARNVIWGEEASSESKAVKLDDQRSFDVVDLVLIFWRHRFYVALSFVIVLGVSLLICLTRPKLYAYSTVIEIGSYVLPEGNGGEPIHRNIEESEKTLSKLKKSFLALEVLYLNKKAVGSASSDEEIAATRVLEPKFEINSASGSNVIELKTLGSLEDESVLLGLLNRVNDRLLADHNRKLMNAGSKLMHFAEQQQVKVEKLQATLLAINEDIKLLVDSKKGLENERKVVVTQLGRYQDKLIGLEQSRQRQLVEASKQESSPVISLLIDNAVIGVEKLRDDLELRLSTGIFMDIAEIDKDVAILRQSLVVAETDLRNAKRMLARTLNTQLSDDSSSLTSKSLSAVGDDSYFDLPGLESTRVVLQPYRSFESVSLSLSSQIVLCFLVAVLLALIIGLVRELFVRVCAEIGPPVHC